LNFLHDSDSNTSFIETSLTTLRAECYPAYQAMCGLMAGRSVILTIGAETMQLVVGPDEVDITHPNQRNDSHPHLSTSAQTILDLADGKTTILSALLSGSLDLKGSLQEIARIYEALMAYLRGAVRCPSFPQLLDNFREVQSRSQPISS